MIDSHAHVHDKAFDADRDAVVERARAAGVDRLITVGCDLADSRHAIEAARRYGIFASAGIHPHAANSAPEDVALALAPLIEEPYVVAVGETGLDFYYSHSPPDAQERVLRAQIGVARERKLPLIFHVRDAHVRMLQILREEFEPGMRGVVHCFTGNADQAEAYVCEFALFLGIGGIVTFKNAATLRDAVKAVGVDALLLETDSPYLAPMPLRGRRNEPAFMTHTLETLAQILGNDRAAVESTTTENAIRCFELMR